MDFVFGKLAATSAHYTENANPCTSLPMSMHIREYRSEDQAELIALWDASGLTRPWNDPATDITLAVQARESTLLVGLKNGAIMASVMIGFDGHRGWVYYLCVDAAFRGRGHGRELMIEAEAWLRDRKAPKIQLMVRSDNAGAEQFYQALGYEMQAVTVLGKRLDEDVGVTKVQAA